MKRSRPEECNWTMNLRIALFFYLQAIAVVQLADARHSCDFDYGLCPEWSQENYTDDFDWTHNSGSTPSWYTGPSSGHGGYGYYMYIDTSSPRSYGDKARLEYSVPSPDIGKLSCLTFYYHMYGTTINRLNVYNGQNYRVFTKSGAQGNVWRKAKQSMTLQRKVIFEGISGTSSTGDIAIDNVSFTDGMCTGCNQALNQSFGRLKIRYTDGFDANDSVCYWTIGNTRLAQPVAIVWIRQTYFWSCRDFVKVFNGDGTQIFARTGCGWNYHRNTFLEIPFAESSNITIQVSLAYYWSYVKIDYGVLSEGLSSASHLAGWNVTAANISTYSFQLRWTDLEDQPNIGARFYLVILNKTDSDVPVRKLLYPNSTSTQMTGLMPHTEYNISVIAISGDGTPYKSEDLLVRTDEVGCGSIVNNRLRSPGYPSNYLNNMNCVYPVSIPFSKDLYIYFYYFSLEYSSTCGYDYLEITNNRNQTIGQYCGDRTGFSLIVTGSYVEFRFRSDGSVTERGFDLALHFVSPGNSSVTPQPPTTTPTPTPTPTNSSGCGSIVNNRLRSPGYPFNYLNNMNCVYPVSIPFSKDLYVYFYYFSLEYSSNCGYDYLEITNDRHQTIGKYCGGRTGFSLIVTGGYVEFRFRSDGSVTERGFDLALYFVSSGYSSVTPQQPTRPPTRTPTPTTSSGCFDQGGISLCAPPFLSGNSCMTYFNFTKIFCAKTCGFCQAPTSEPPTPSEEQQKESVMLRIRDLDVREWDQVMEDAFKNQVARAASEYCGNDGVQCEPERSRRRRSSEMTFTPDMVHILPGYPRKSPDDPEITLLAFYLSVPRGVSGDAVVNKDILQGIVESYMSNIEQSMDSKIDSVAPVEGSSDKLQNKNEDDKEDKESNPLILIIAASVGGLVFIALVAVFVLRCRIYKRLGRARHVDGQEDTNSPATNSTNATPRDATKIVHDHPGSIEQAIEMGLQGTPPSHVKPTHKEPKMNTTSFQQGKSPTVKGLYPSLTGLTTNHPESSVNQVCQEAEENENMNQGTETKSLEKMSEVNNGNIAENLYADAPSSSRYISGEAKEENFKDVSSRDTDERKQVENLQEDSFHQQGDKKD